LRARKVIKIQNLTLSYGLEEEAVLRRVNLEFAAGELVLICGPTGSGKSTLLRAINRLVPAFSGGALSGEVFIAGKGTSNLKPHDLASLVGYVDQVPERSFVAQTVIDELAFGMEQLGFTRSEMKKNIERFSKLLEIETILHHNLMDLSGGQQQRVAIAAALAAGQKILLLDEPTSALDAEGAESLVVLLRKIATEEQVTVLLAEHRLEKVIPHCDWLVAVAGYGSAVKLSSDWNSVEATWPSWSKDRKSNKRISPAKLGYLGQTSLEVSNLTVKFSNQVAVQNVSFSVNKSEIVCIHGANGSGKSSLLLAIQGSLKTDSGQVLVENVNRSSLRNRELHSKIVMVPQKASDLLFLSSVSKELSESDVYANVAPRTTSKIFEKLVNRVEPKRHPRDLSVGQQLALVIALQLSFGAKLVLLDEPTRGLDQEAKRNLAQYLIGLSESGVAILVATHERDFSKLISDREFLMENSRLIPCDSLVGGSSEI
jgi:energy-coupling factor transport system ATP-binding protein